MARTGRRALHVQARRQYVLSLRRTGASYEVIYQAAVRRFGAELPPSYSRFNVFRDVLEALKPAQAEQTRNVEALRTLELERLDQLMLALYPLAVGKPADLERGTAAVPPDLEALRQVL